MAEEAIITEEMIEAAYKLEQAAAEYKRLCIEHNGHIPVVWIQNNEPNSDGIFIADSFNAMLIKESL